MSDETKDATWIYGLIDPRTNLVGYVGASVDPTKRYRFHVTPGDQGMGSRNVTRAWINALLDQGVTPELVILDQVPSRHTGVGGRHPAVAEAEDRWMVRLTNEGHPLTNSRVPDELKAKDPDEELMREAIERGCEMFGEAN